MEENISQTQPAEASIEPETSREFLVRKPLLKIILFAVLGLILVGGLVLAGGLVFSGIQIGKKHTQTVIQPTPTPSVVTLPTSTPTVVITPILDPTADWKTYTNIALGFSFKYPSDYFKFQQDYPNTGVYFAPSQGKGGNGPKFLKLDDVWLDASILSGANLKSLDEYLTLPGQQIYPTNSQKTPTTIDGVSGYIIVYDFPVSAGNITEYTKVGIVLKNETIYTISLSAWSQEVLRANQKMFDQILSTFRFLPSTGSTGSP